MKKSNFLWGLLFLFGFLMLPALTQAQKQKKIYNRFHCKLYLKDGRVVDSYLLGKYLSYTDSVVHLSDNPNGFFPKSQKYYNADIDSMLQWTDDYPELVIHLLPVKVRHSYDVDTLMVDSLRYPSMVMHQYRGKNVDGFAVWDMWSGFRYLYKTHDMDAAHT